MNGLTNDPCRLDPVEPQHRARAFDLVFRDLPADQRGQQTEALMAAVDSGELLPEGLLGAYRQDRLVGTVLWQLLPGRTAMLWPPRLVGAEDPATDDDLLKTACGSLQAHGVAIAQALLERPNEADDQLLCRHGFEHMADMLYLVSMEVEFPTTAPQTRLKFTPYSDRMATRLAHIVKATYEQSLDCPAMDGVRSIEDVLEGYRATGQFDPSRWLIVEHGNRDVGCLLLADHPEHGNWELVYMGVVASQRGRGWGVEIAQHAQWLTRQAARARLVLAVDAANGPGIKMYSAAGFQAWDRRAVYLKTFGNT